MPYLQFDLDAKRECRLIARATGVPVEVIGWGLLELWEHCWREKQPNVGALMLAGFFGPQAEALISHLVAHGFLEDIGPAMFRVRGAERYLRITDARQAAGKIRAIASHRKQGKFTSTPPAASQHVTSTSPANAGDLTSTRPAPDQLLHRASSIEHQQPKLKDSARSLKSANGAAEAEVLPLEPTEAPATRPTLAQEEKTTAPAATGTPKLTSGQPGASKRKRTPDEPDPRHAPLVKALTDAAQATDPSWRFNGGVDAKAVANLLKLGDPAEIEARWIRARSRDGFPRVRMLPELVQHWGHFPAAEARPTGDVRKGYARADEQDWSAEALTTDPYFGPKAGAS